jgi:hypothetical protein
VIFIENTTILLAPAATSTLLSLLTFIPSFIPRENEFIGTLLKLQKLTIQNRGRLLDRFTLRQFEEKAVDSIMDLDESNINSEEFFTKIDCYTDHKEILTKLKHAYYRNVFLIRVSLVSSILVLAISQINNMTVKQTVFILGLFLVIISVKSFFKLWALNKQIHSIEACSDFI